MHIPDGMLSNATVTATGVASVGYIGYAVVWIRTHFDQRKVVLMAVTAALIFALQMLNFPVAAGTSGHFAGGALAGILLGPFAAAIVMTTVLLIQAFVFADGGVLALAANVFNLAVVAPLVGYAVWRLFCRLGESAGLRIVGAFVAAWISLIVAAFAAAIEIWLSGNAQLVVVLTAMGFWHAIIGIGEGLVTAGLVAYVLKVRPDLLSTAKNSGAVAMRSLAVGFGVIALVAVAFSFLASSSPDGLEYVYFEQGVGDAFEETQRVKSPIPEYVLPGVENETIAGILAGVVGIIVVGAILYIVTAGLKRSGKRAE